MNDINRRMFLKLGTVSTAAMLAGSAGAQTAPPALDMRTLGRTGMKITTISMGCMRTSEGAVFRAAYDAGINYFDTARVYMDGRNERIVGQALKDVRDKVYIVTKVKPNSADVMRKSIADSLEALGLDYVDLLQLHDISAKDGVLNKEHRDVLAEAKQQGKCKFIGITCHKNEAETVNNIVDDPEKFFDTILVTYNFKSSPALKEAVARAAQANIGVIAMKTQAGGYATKDLGDVSPHQASLKFVLQDKNITAAIPAMVDMAQLKEDMAVMGMVMTRADQKVLDRYARAIAPLYCHRCGVCTGSCPMALDIAHVNRCLMYAEGYGDLRLARDTYKELPAGRNLGLCDACPVCTADCVNGLDLRERLSKARAVLA